MGNQQEDNTETLKKRRFLLELPDTDIDRLCELTGAVGLSPQNLLENFISDLTDGDYSNGADERELARQWFDRCWFSIFPDKTFLRYMLEEAAETVDDVLKYQEEIKFCESELEDTWKDYRTSDGKQCYADKTAWEEEQKGSIETYQEVVHYCQEQLENLWRDYLMWAGEKVMGTLEEELQKLSDWKKACEKVKEEEQEEETCVKQERSEEEEHKTGRHAKRMR